MPTTGSSPPPNMNDIVKNAISKIYVGLFDIEDTTIRNNMTKTIITSFGETIPQTFDPLYYNDPNMRNMLLLSDVKGQWYTGNYGAMDSNGSICNFTNPTLIWRYKYFRKGKYTFEYSVNSNLPIPTQDDRWIVVQGNIYPKLEFVYNYKDLDGIDQYIYIGSYDGNTKSTVLRFEFNVPVDSEYANIFLIKKRLYCFATISRRPKITFENTEVYKWGNDLFNDYYFLRELNSIPNINDKLIHLSDISDLPIELNHRVLNYLYDTIDSEIGKGIKYFNVNILSEMWNVNQADISMVIAEGTTHDQHKWVETDGKYDWWDYDPLYDDSEDEPYGSWLGFGYTINKVIPESNGVAIPLYTKQSFKSGFDRDFIRLGKNQTYGTLDSNGVITANPDDIYFGPNASYLQINYDIPGQHKVYGPKTSYEYINLKNDLSGNKNSMLDANFGNEWLDISNIKQLFRDENEYDKINKKYVYIDISGVTKRDWKNIFLKNIINPDKVFVKFNITYQNNATNEFKQKFDRYTKYINLQTYILDGIPVPIYKEYRNKIPELRNKNIRYEKSDGTKSDEITIQDTDTIYDNIRNPIQTDNNKLWSYANNRCGIVANFIDTEDIQSHTRQDILMPIIRKTILDNSFNYWDLSKSIPRPIEIIQDELESLQRFNMIYKYKYGAHNTEKLFNSAGFDASWNDISNSDIEIKIDSTFKNINIYDDNGEIISDNIFSNANELLDFDDRLDIPDKIIPNLYLSLLTNYTDQNYNISIDASSSYVLKKEGLINWINMQIRGNPYIEPPTSVNPHFKMYINSDGYTLDNSNSVFIEGFKNYINDFDPIFKWDVYNNNIEQFMDVSDISMNELIDKGDISYNWPIKLSHSSSSKNASNAELLFDGYQMKDIIREIDKADKMNALLKLNNNNNKAFDSIYYYKEDAFTRDTFIINLNDNLFTIHTNGGEELFIRNKGSLFIELSNNNINSFKDRSKNKLVTGYLQNILKLKDERTDSEYKRITIDILTQDNYSNVLNYLYTDENKLKFSDSSIEINTSTTGSPSWHDISNQILFTSNNELPIIVNRHRSNLSGKTININNINVYYEVYDFETNDISFVKIKINTISPMEVNIPNNSYDGVTIKSFDDLYYSNDNKSGITGSFYKIELDINSLENYYIQENNTIVLTNNITSTTQDSSDNYIYDTNWAGTTYPDTNPEIYVYNGDSALFGENDSKIAFFKYSQQNILKEYKPDRQDYDNNNSLILTNIINENDISFNLSYVINVDTYDTDLVTNDHAVFNPITELGIFETIDLSFGDIFIGNHHNIARTKDLSYVAWGMNNYKQINDSNGNIRDISKIDISGAITVGEYNTSYITDDGKLYINGLYNDISYSKHFIFDTNTVDYDKQISNTINYNDTYDFNEAKNIYVQDVENNLKSVFIYSSKYGILKYFDNTGFELDEYDYDCYFDKSSKYIYEEPEPENNVVYDFVVIKLDVTEKDVIVDVDDYNNINNSSIYRHGDNNMVVKIPLYKNCCIKLKTTTNIYNFNIYDMNPFESMTLYESNDNPRNISTNIKGLIDSFNIDISNNIGTSRIITQILYTYLNTINTNDAESDIYYNIVMVANKPLKTVEDLSGITLNMYIDEEENDDLGGIVNIVNVSGNKIYINLNYNIYELFQSKFIDEIKISYTEPTTNPIEGLYDNTIMESFDSNKPIVINSGTVLNLEDQHNSYAILDASNDKHYIHIMFHDDVIDNSGINATDFQVYKNNESSPINYVPSIDISNGMVRLKYNNNSLSNNLIYEISYNKHIMPEKFDTIFRDNSNVFITTELNKYVRYDISENAFNDIFIDDENIQTNLKYYTLFESLPNNNIMDISFTNIINKEYIYFTNIFKNYIIYKYKADVINTFGSSEEFYNVNYINNNPIQSIKIYNNFENNVNIFAINNKYYSDNILITIHNHKPYNFIIEDITNTNIIINISYSNEGLKQPISKAYMYENNLIVPTFITDNNDKYYIDNIDVNTYDYNPYSESHGNIQSFLTMIYDNSNNDIFTSDNSLNLINSQRITTIQKTDTYLNKIKFINGSNATTLDMSNNFQHNIDLSNISVKDLSNNIYIGFDISKNSTDHCKMEIIQYYDKDDSLYYDKINTFHYNAIETNINSIDISLNLIQYFTYEYQRIKITFTIFDDSYNVNYYNSFNINIDGIEDIFDKIIIRKNTKGNTPPTIYNPTSSYNALTKYTSYVKDSENNNIIPINYLNKSLFDYVKSISINNTNSPIPLQVKYFDNKRILTTPAEISSLESFKGSNDISNNNIVIIEYSLHNIKKYAYQLFVYSNYSQLFNIFVDISTNTNTIECEYYPLFTAITTSYTISIYDLSNGNNSTNYLEINSYEIVNNNNSVDPHLNTYSYSLTNITDGSSIEIGDYVFTINIKTPLFDITKILIYENKYDSYTFSHNNNNKYDNIPTQINSSERYTSIITYDSIIIGDYTSHVIISLKKTQQSSIKCILNGLEIYDLSYDDVSMNSSNESYNILIPTYNNPTNNLTHTIINGPNIIKIIDSNNFTYEITVEYYGEMKPFIPLDNFIGLSRNNNIPNNIFTNGYKRRLYQTDQTSWYINNISTIQDVSKIYSIAVKYNDSDISLNTDYSNNIISLNDIIDDTIGISTDKLENKLLHKLFHRNFITNKDTYTVLFDIEYMHYNSDDNTIVRKQIYNINLDNLQLMINNNIFYNINDDIHRELYLLDDVRIIDEFNETSTNIYYWMNRNGSIRINYPEQEHSKIYVNVDIDNNTIELKYINNNNGLENINNNFIEDVYTYFATGITGDFISFTLFIKNQPYGENPQISYYINDNDLNINKTYNMIYISNGDLSSNQINKLTIYTFEGEYTIYIPYKMSDAANSNYCIDIKNKNNVLLIKEYNYTDLIINNIHSEVNYLQYQKNTWVILKNTHTSQINPTISINNTNYILDNSSYEFTIMDSNIVTIDISTNSVSLNTNTTSTTNTNIPLKYYIQFSNRMYNEIMLVGNDSNFYHKDIFSNNSIMSFYICAKYQITGTTGTTTEINQTIDSFKIKFS
jgi:hypothetical protein